MTSRNRRGFSLLEVLASVVIVGVALSVLVIERNRAVARVGDTDRLRMATVLAGDKLGEILMGTETAGGGEFEDHEGFRWSVRENQTTFGEGSSVLLPVIEVTVTYGPERTVSLTAVGGR